MRIVIFLGLCRIVTSGSAILLGCMVGKMNDDMWEIENWLLITWAPGCKPAVVSTDWDPAELEYS